MKVSWIAIGVLGYLAYRAYSIKNTIDALTYSIAGLIYNRQNSSLLKSELLLQLAVKNNTANALSFSSFTGTATLNNYNIASYNVTGNTVIRPNAVTLITVPIVVYHANVALQVINVIKAWITGTLNTAIYINGLLTAGGINIPVQDSVQLKGSNIAGVKSLGNTPFTFSNY